MKDLKKRNNSGVFKKLLFVFLLLNMVVFPIFAKAQDKQEGKLKQFMNIFANNGSENTVAQAIIGTVDEFMSLSTSILSGNFQNTEAKQIFYLMMVLFFIFSCMYFVLSQNLFANNPNWAEGVQIGVKMLIGFAIFIVAPYLPRIFIKLSWWISEVITGTPSGTMDYTLPLTSFGWGNFGAGVITAGGIGGVSIIDPEIAGFKIISGSGIGSLSSLAFAFAVAGIGGAVTATLMYCVNCLELYFATVVLILYLPSTLFNGFNAKSMSYFKYLWTNFLEMFLMNIMILLVCKLSEMGFPSNSFVSVLVGNVLKPTLLLILLPASSKIINSLVNGGGSADTTGGVQQGIRGITGGVAKAGVLGKMAKGSASGIKGRMKDKKDLNQLSQVLGNTGFKSLSKEQQKNIKSMMSSGMARKMVDNANAEKVREAFRGIRGANAAKENVANKSGGEEKKAG